MADEVWYYLENRQQRGPVSFEELQALVQAGTVRPDDMVWSPEMSEWAPASTVPDLVPRDLAAPPPPPPSGGPGFTERSKSIFKSAASRADSLPHVAGIDKLLDRLGGWLDRQRLDGWDRIGRVLGHWAYLLAALLLALTWLILGIREDQGEWIVHGVIGVPLVAIVLHFVAVRFLEAGGHLLDRTPTRLASRAFPRCLGLLFLLGSVGALLRALFVLFDDGDVVGFAVWLALSVVLLYAAGAALSLDSLRIEVGETAGAGEEAVGILGFLFKIPLRLVSVLFGALAVAGLVFVIYALVKVLGGDVSVLPAWDAGPAQILFVNPGTMFLASLLRGTEILFVALIPLVVYLYFLFYYLFLALANAILAIPGQGRPDAKTTTVLPSSDEG